MKIEQIFFVNVTLSLSWLRLTPKVSYKNLLVCLFHECSLHIYCHIYSTTHNLSYVLFMKLKIEHKFDRNRINLLNIDIWRIQYMD